MVLGQTIGNMVVEEMVQSDKPRKGWTSDVEVRELPPIQENEEVVVTGKRWGGISPQSSSRWDDVTNMAPKPTVEKVTVTAVRGLYAEGTVPNSRVVNDGTMEDRNKAAFSYALTTTLPDAITRSSGQERRDLQRLADEYKKFKDRMRVVFDLGPYDEPGHAKLVDDPQRGKIAEIHLSSTFGSWTDERAYENHSLRSPAFVAQAAVALHEVRHAIDQLKLGRNLKSISLESFTAEQKAYRISYEIYRAYNGYSQRGLWSPTWLRQYSTKEINTMVTKAIDRGACQSSRYCPGTSSEGVTTLGH